MARRPGTAARPVLIGTALVLVAGIFDAEPLYVPGVALVLLALTGAVWVRLATRELRVARTIAATRVVEGEPLLVEVDVRSGRFAPPSGEVLDPLLREPARLRPGRRRTRVRIRARFARRGRRRLEPPRIRVSDPLGLAARAVAAPGPPDEILVLPRIEPLQAPGTAGQGRAGSAGRLTGAAEIDLDGLRAHRPGSPASRIAWPVYSRTGELHERALRADADARPLVVLDLRGSAVEGDVDAAVRAAASLTVHLAERGGCALLLPGERRPLAIEPGLRAWPAAHARLAVAEAGEGPSLGGLGMRRGAVAWVAARPLREPPRVLTRTGSGTPILVVPGTVPGRRALFRVAGCSGYALGRPRGPARAPATAGEARA